MVRSSGGHDTLDCCARHEEKIDALEERLRGIEMEIARNGARVAIIAGIAAAIASTVMTVGASLLLHWMTK